MFTRSIANSIHAHLKAVSKAQGGSRAEALLIFRQNILFMAFWQGCRAIPAAVPPRFPAGLRAAERRSRLYAKYGLTNFQGLYYIFFNILHAGGKAWAGTILTKLLIGKKRTVLNGDI
jgi:hypothetical protein